MRLRSDVWVSALVRRAEAEGAYASVMRSGDPAAGAVFVSVDRLDGTHDLHAPAPQFMAEEGDLFRRLETVMKAADPKAVVDRIAREAKFDGDLWWVEIVDRRGRPFVDPPPLDPDAAPKKPDWPPRV